ncbi:MAG: flavodoxin domain-containing protein [Proteobacteria bacterium]|nr:flavodoxin domain-containing protein [Pseudomonadota bacterium]MBU1582505.1 flavodoxin domain-containing protein [Pseudomonadota bacterium]MBU2631847.1 flavodoxin domain-containing protein [Pseudomonadota bacterium]
MKNMTRRQFVVNSSMTVGGLITAGAIPLGMVSPNLAYAQEGKFVESSCGTKGKKILVAYESFCGSTSEVAQSIADVFCKQGARVNVRHVQNIETLSSYDGVVIGSAVKSASWHPSAIEFVKENQDMLKQIPVAYFLTCLALYFDTTEAQDLAESYFRPVLTAVPGIKPKAVQAFAGVLDYGKLNMMFRLVMKAKMKKQGIPEGDFRDFQKIESWAEKTVWPLLTGV